jgi:hypothetical protein
MSKQKTSSLEQKANTLQQQHNVNTTGQHHQRSNSIPKTQEAPPKPKQEHQRYGNTPILQQQY